VAWKCKGLGLGCFGFHSYGKISSKILVFSLDASPDFYFIFSVDGKYSRLFISENSAFPMGSLTAMRKKTAFKKDSTLNLCKYLNLFSG